MLLAITRKELHELFRDRVVVWVFVVFLAILAVRSIAYTATWVEHDRVQLTRQNEAREEWLAQTTGSAHQATHDGQTVYRRQLRLAAIDPGTDAVLGNSIRLESHKRHDAVGVMQPDYLSFFRLSFDTPALLVQAILPLVAILLSYAGVASEREYGTWNFLATLGVKRSTVVLGKLVAIFVIVAAMTLPLLVSLVWAVTTASDEAVLTIGDLNSRAAALAAANLVYLFGWCATGVALSSRCSAGTTLVLLVACWVTWTLAVPRVAVDLAYSQHPLPSRAAMQESRESAVRHGSDGKRSLDEFNAQLERRLLRQYDVENLDELPIDINAARLLAMEEFTDAVDDDALSQLAAVYEQQNEIVDRFEFVSPYLAVRSLSMAVAGTDRRHHEAFLESAEQYRRQYVKILNTAEMKGEGPGETAESALQFWSRVPEFKQTVPTLPEVLVTMKWPIGLLTAWSVTMTLIALWPPREFAT